MKIDFPKEKLQKQLESDRDMTRKYGPDVARKIKARLLQLRAADCLADLTGSPGGWHELSGDRKGQIAAKLHGAFRLIFEPVEPVPRKADGGIDRSRVEAVQILEIVDYH